jgi:hypothetical protein
VNGSCPFSFKAGGAFCYSEDMARTEIVNRDSGHEEIRVILSRRNLLALLHKLDMPGSHREIHNNDVFIDGEEVPINSVMLILNCEDDDEHYGKRQERGHPGPGEMHPDTEGFIRSARS